LRLAVALVDSRHAPSPQDEEMLGLLEEAEVPTLVVATKIDKLKRSERGPNLQRIRDAFGFDGEALLVPFSTVTGEGRDELWSVIAEMLDAS
jgi:GTP-binding protein